MPAIQTKGLKKRYKAITAVDGLDLEIEQGELQQALRGHFCFLASFPQREIMVY